jgi:broad specificity phosphatase PhoE
MATPPSSENDFCDFYFTPNFETEQHANGKVWCGGCARDSQFDLDLTQTSRDTLPLLADKVAALRPFAAICTSNFKRTIGTAEPIAKKLGLPLQIVERSLDELNHGALLGLTTKECKETPSWQAYSKLSRVEKLVTRQADRAETNCEVIDRVRSFCLATAPKYLGKAVICCTSDGAIRSLLNLAAIENISGPLENQSSAEAVKKLPKEAAIKEADHYDPGQILHIRVNPRTQEIRIIEPIITLLPKEG